MNIQLRKKAGRTNPQMNMGDREGTLKGLKIELGGHEDAIDGENQGRGKWHFDKCDWRDYLVFVTLT